MQITIKPEKERTVTGMTKGPVATQGRILELDGLRGLAILLVLSFHYINNQLEHYTGRMGVILFKMTSFGWAGVDLFFVLSGFLIGTILFRYRQSKNFFSTFYIRRIVRIIPNYYLLIAIFLLLVAMPYFSQSAFLHNNNVIPWWSYFLMIHNIYMGHLNNLGSNAVNVTWSIGIEEQFYLVFPFIVYFSPKKWIPWVLVLAIILASVIREYYIQWIPRYVFLPCRMDSIAFGALAAWFNEEYSLGEMVRKFSRWFWLIMALNAGACACLIWKFRDLGVNRHFFLALFFTGCLVAALTWENSFYGAFLRNKWLTWIGTISYSLYLFHYLILAMLEYCLLGYSGGVAVTNSKDLAVSLLSLGLSFLFAWFVYKKLETPFVRFGKRFKY